MEEALPPKRRRGRQHVSDDLRLLNRFKVKEMKPATFRARGL